MKCESQSRPLNVFREPSAPCIAQDRCVVSLATPASIIVFQLRASAQVFPRECLATTTPDGKPVPTKRRTMLGCGVDEAAARRPDTRCVPEESRSHRRFSHDCSAARRPGRGMRGERRRRRPLRASVSCRGGIARGCAVSQVRDKARNRRSTRRRGDRLPANNRPSAFRSAECACVYPM